MKILNNLLLFFIPTTVIAILGYQAYHHATHQPGHTPLVILSDSKNASDAVASKEDFTMLFTKAQELFKENNYTQALELNQKALELNPDHRGANLNLGVTLSSLGRYEEANTTFKNLLAKDPSYLKAHLNLIRSLIKQGNIEKALEQSKQAIALDSNNSDVYSFIGNALLEKSAYPQAQPFFEKALALQPNSLSYTLELGHTLMAQGKADEAYKLFKNIEKNHPTDYLMPLALGQACERNLNMVEAVTYYKKAVQLNPDNPNTHIALAGAYIAQGNYEEGFKEYEWRWKTSNMASAEKKWDGKQAKDKKIIILAENGLGDIIQFVRFARSLKEQGAHIIVQTPKPLVKLFSLCDYIDEIILPRSVPPAFDALTSAQSLAYNCKTTVDTIPQPPYLKADETLVEHWKQQLKYDKNFKVGLCWKSGGEHINSPAMKRSIDLHKFLPLAGIKDVSFYSLQKGEGLEQLKNLPNFKIAEFGPDFDTTHGGFMDTAALMKNLDLVISIDTSVAHLAGALSVPTWVLLPYNPDSRWMLDPSTANVPRGAQGDRGEKTPWYPSITLFRQSKPGDWDTVIKQVKIALGKKLTA